MSQIEDPVSPVPGTRTSPVVAASMLTLCVAELAGLYTGAVWPHFLAYLAFLVFVVFAFDRLGRREYFLLALTLALTGAALILRPDALALFHSAADRAVFLAAFMILLALLREGAVTSPAVLQVGTYMTRQPPGRRYLSIHLGGHMLGIVLNFGSLNLLGPLIMRGIAASSDNPAVASIRVQRQISALSRGFSWMVAWSPTAITQAIVFAIVPGVDPVRMIGVGLLLVALTTLAGWALDWQTGREARRIIPPDARPQYSGPDPFPTRGARDFGAVCGALALTTLAIIAGAGVTTVPALMLAAPIITILWMVRQTVDAPDRHTVLRTRFSGILRTSMPQGSPEAVTLACAGYCGICAAGLVDPEAFSQLVALTKWHEFGFYAAAMLLPVALSNVGLPPLMVITFLGTLLSGLPGLDYDPTLLALGFCVGWALNLTGSPFGVTAIILARITGGSTRDLTWRWNGAFSVASFAIASLVLIAFSNG